MDELLQEIAIQAQETFNYVFWCNNKACSEYYMSKPELSFKTRKLMLKDKNIDQYCEVCGSYLQNKGVETNNNKENNYKFAYASVYPLNSAISLRNYMNNRFEKNTK